MDVPETRYARSGDVNIAYQVVGDGPTDLVLIPGWIFHLDVVWEDPSWERLMRRLTSDFRVILFDKRGTGLSDRSIGASTLEDRMDDVRAVMDAVGSARAAVMGWSEGGTIGLLYAATYPDRVSHLILYGSAARFIQAPDYPDGMGPEFMTIANEIIGGPVWGQGYLSQFVVPSRADDEAFRRWFGRYERLSVSPGEATAMMRVNMEIDLRHILPSVRVPTLILHQTRDHLVPVELGRYMATRIPRAKMVELPGEDHLFWFSGSDAMVSAIREFVVGAPSPAEPDRVLSTVLFTDIVGSTRRAADVGDRRWREMLEDHHAFVGREVARFLGRGVKTLGDGVLATFDGPARAIRCAAAIRDGEKGRGMEVRAGLHTGEVEVIGDDVGGIAVHIGARVAALAAPGEVLVSSTVKDLVAGSGIAFDDRGMHELKGVPGEWRLYSVTTA